mmetsp:Transcript_8496/g.13101  ORF Transcript_8496/g.13101 Transcript_8496/m.13101 type:complete len:104 (+) Transcript_8496:1898-2209(+)
MRHYRSKVTRLGDLGVASQKAAMVWVVLQCHRIMEEFLVLKFESHASIIREISMFILTECVDPDDIGKIQAEIKKLKEERQDPSTHLHSHLESFRELKRSFEK